MGLLRSPSLNELLKSVRVMLRQESPDNSSWSDAALSEWINDAIRRYFLELAQENEGQFDKSVTLDLVANQETVDMPADFFMIKTLHRVIGNDRIILEYNAGVSENWYANTSGVSAYYEPSYFLRVNQLVLRPFPPQDETGGLLLEYTAFPETIIFGGDVMSAGISPVFKELIIGYTVYKAKYQEDLTNNSSTSAKAAAHLQYLETIFKETVGNRSKYPQFTVPYNPGGDSHG